jgi:hypothetical protein
MSFTANSVGYFFFVYLFSLNKGAHLYSSDIRRDMEKTLMGEIPEEEESDEEQEDFLLFRFSNIYKLKFFFILF